MRSGATRTSPPTSSGPASGRWSAASCPTRTSACSSREDLARLREVTASQGLMLESVSERLMETVHAGSPTKHPAKRLATIEAAGELKIPFTSGILVGIGETEEERVDSLEALAKLHQRYGHLQEVILQNFVPHPRYYGARGSRDRRRGSAKSVERRGGQRLRVLPMPEWATPVSIDDVKRLVAGVPAVDAGRGDSGAAEPVGPVGGVGRGGGDGPGRAVGQRRPHFSRARVSRARTRCARALLPRAMR